MIKVGEVGMIKLSDITVEDRARGIMGDLDGLEESMKHSGLILPLAVQRTESGYRLLAGERRFRVLERNKVEIVPVRIYNDELSELEQKVIEKAENFYRKDFEYHELDALVAEITSMQQEALGAKKAGKGSIEGWGTKDTGEMFGMTKSAVSTAIKRHEAREAFPELFEKCKTQTDASKVIKKMDEAMVKEVLARKIEETKQSSSSKKLADSFIVGDFFKKVKEIPDNIFHLVEIDPPYSIDLQKAKKKSGESKYQLDEYHEVPPSVYMDGGDNGHPWKGLKTVFKECYRVMSEHSWLICWFGPDPWFEQIYIALRESGFGCTRLCGIWTKHSGQSMNPTIRLANSYEMFFYAWKGNPALNKAGRSNQFDYSALHSSQKTHPTERPLDLMLDIYETFAFPSSRVLIPFLGSGVGLIAANILGMDGIGFELSKSHRDSFLVKTYKS